MMASDSLRLVTVLSPLVAGPSIADEELKRNPMNRQEN